MTFLRPRSNNLAGTALVSGGVVSTASPTTIDITAGLAVFMDHSDPQAPAQKLVSFGPFIGVSPTALLSASNTFLSVNELGQLLQRTSLPISLANVREEVFIGFTQHPAGTIVLSSFVVFAPYSDLVNTVTDLATSIGDINVSGNIISPNGSNLNFDKSGGETFAIQRNLGVDHLHPNIITSPMDSPVTFISEHRDGVGGYTTLAPTSTLDVANYDDGSGTLQSVGANEWTNFRVVFGSGTAASFYFVLYGQTLYTGGTAAADAVAAIPTEQHDRDPILFQLETIGVISTRGGAVDLSLTADAAFTTTRKIKAV